jgi:hypothetical protein
VRISDDDMSLLAVAVQSAAKCIRRLVRLEAEYHMEHPEAHRPGPGRAGGSKPLCFPKFLSPLVNRSESSIRQDLWMGRQLCPEALDLYDQQRLHLGAARALATMSKEGQAAVLRHLGSRPVVRETDVRRSKKLFKRGGGATESPRRLPPMPLPAELQVALHCSASSSQIIE